MKTKENLYPAFIGLILASLALPAIAHSSDALTSPTKLGGVVTYRNPIVGATIRVLDPAGHVLVEQHGATDHDGLFSVVIPPSHTGVPPGTAESTDGLRVEATGGHDGMANFTEKLVGIASDHGPDKDFEKSFVHVNAATTLSTAYHDLKTGVSVEQADARTLAFLDAGVPTIGYSIENPYLTTFSPRALAAEAHAAGGLEHLATTLAHEMAKDSEATHPFPAHTAVPALGGPAEWIAEKLITGMVTSAGSQIFGKLQAGMGFPSESTAIYLLLEQVNARLAAIEKTLRELERKMTQYSYDQRAMSMWKSYVDFDRIVREVKSLNNKAKPNRDAIAKGQPINEVLAKEVREATQALIDELRNKGMKFVTDVHAEFFTEGTITPIQKLFSELVYKDEDTVIIDKKYFKKVNDQLEQYRSYQATVLALTVDAELAFNKTLAETHLEVGKQYIFAEKVVYPDVKLFTSKHLQAVQDGRGIYDKPLNLIYPIGYTKFSGPDDLWKYQTTGQGGGIRLASWDELKALISHSKLNGRTWKQVTQELGFSAQEVNSAKMIVQKLTKSPRGYGYYWFGDDRSGPWDHYLDGRTQFEKVRNERKMGLEIYSMIVLEVL